jgi:hypothetical protein
LWAQPTLPLLSNGHLYFAFSNPSILFLSLSKKETMEKFCFQKTAWFINIVTLITVITSSLVVYYRRWRTERRGEEHTKARLPSGTFGWPVIGETLDFISCAYSPSPESFMEKRRLLSVSLSSISWIFVFGKLNTIF